MKAIDVILQAAYFLNDDETVCKINENDYDGCRDIDFYLRCLNLVYNEIASEYMPLEHSDKVKVVKNAFSTTALGFSKKLLRVLKVKRLNGEEVRFKECGDEVVLIDNADEVVVTYHYLPESLALGSQLEYRNIPSLRTFAYGVAAEYCIVHSLYDEASLWDRRYKESLNGISKKYREMSVKRRDWV